MACDVGSQFPEIASEVAIMNVSLPGPEARDPVLSAMVKIATKAISKNILIFI
jgi:hypothetical protein